MNLREPERRALVEALSQKEAYPHPVEGPVRVIETHVSHLFLTGNFVYKLKKPVDLGFLDFTTLDRRRDFTFRELELNRRLSPDVYLGVVEVRRDSEGRLRVEGDGEVQEYALKMRELPADRSLMNLLQAGKAGVGEIEAIGRFLARFHASAARADPASPSGTLETVTKQVLDNLAVASPSKVLGLEGSLVEVDAFSRAFLDARAADFVARRENGWIRDCHGDLHTANIFLESGATDTGEAIRIIDRIEFGDVFRFIDIASDLAFLSMDLRYLGRPELAAGLVRAYDAEMGKGSLADMLPFYEAYRAMVRCKVNLLLLAEHGGRPARQAKLPEAGLAARYAALALQIVTATRPRALYVMTGVVGTGKSTVARELARRWNVPHVSSDVVRKTMFGLDPGRPSDPAIRNELYSPRMHARTYGTLHSLAEAELAEGRSVILDASFLKRDHRKRAREIAREYRVPYLILECRCPDGVARERLARRYASGTSESDAGPELLGWQLSQREPVSKFESDGHVVIDTSGQVEEYIPRAQADVWRILLARQAFMRQHQEG
ncbi:MAG: AAA family ATPase [Chloroflexi bacterium]|nr:AAA family ATPase [Chloroflexota bacterium]